VAPRKYGPGKWFGEHTFAQPSKFPGDPKVKQGPPIKLAATPKKRLKKKSAIPKGKI